MPEDVTRPRPPPSERTHSNERAERPGSPVLLYPAGADGGQRTVVLDGSTSPLTVGRDPGVDVCLHWDLEVSRVHAKLERVDGHWTVADAGLSQNGSYVNDERVRGRRRLDDGDVLRFGRTPMTFRAPPAAPSAGRTVVSDRIASATDAPPPPPRVRDAERDDESPPSAPPRRRLRVALLAVVVVLVALVVAGQLVLPGIAEQRVRDALEADGEVTSVEVSAFPALTLLWGDADSVTVRMGSYRQQVAESAGDSSGLGGALADLRPIERIDVSVGSLSVSPLMLRDVRLTKRGPRLAVQARLSDRSLRDSLPPGLEVRPSPAADGIVLNAGVEAFGTSADGAARVVAEDGRLLIRPDGFPLADLASVVVFADERVGVTDLRTRNVPGGYIVRLRGRLR